MKRSGTVSMSDPSRRSRAVNPGSKCTELLSSSGIKPGVFPSYDGVLAFFSSANANLSKMDETGFACLKKEISLLSKGTTDPIVKRVIRDERSAIGEKIATFVSMKERESKGSYITMSTKPNTLFKEFR